MECYLATIANQ